MNKYIRSLSTLLVFLFLGFSMHTNAIGLEGFDEGISVYPNPATHSIQIQYKGDSNANPVITLHNLLGQEVIRIDQEANPTARYIVEITDIPSGVYILQFDCGKEILTQRVTKR